MDTIVKLTTTTMMITVTEKMRISHRIKVLAMSDLSHRAKPTTSTAIFAVLKKAVVAVMKSLLDVTRVPRFFVPIMFVEQISISHRLRTRKHGDCPIVKSLWLILPHR